MHARHRVVTIATPLVWRRHGRGMASDFTVCGTIDRACLDDAELSHLAFSPLKCTPTTNGRLITGLPPSAPVPRSQLPWPGAGILAMSCAMSTQTCSGSQNVLEGLEYAFGGGWLRVVENLIRWLRVASCYQYAYLLDRDAHSAAPYSPPHVESGALDAVFGSLGLVHNTPPANLTPDQHGELRALRRQASRFVQYRRRQLANQALAVKRAVANVAQLQAEWAAQEPPIPTPFVMAATDLADALGVPTSANAVENALRRYAEKNPGCRDEIKNPRKGEPRYVYRVKDVWAHLLSKLPSWRASPPISN
jgi:hypothetical protein